MTEPRHEKTCLQGFVTRKDSNQPGQLQGLDSLQSLDLASIGIILCRQQTTKALIRLHGCAGCSASLLFIYGINRYSHDVAHASYQWDFC